MNGEVWMYEGDKQGLVDYIKLISTFNKHYQWVCGVIIPDAEHIEMHHFFTHEELFTSGMVFDYVVCNGVMMMQPNDNPKPGSIRTITRKMYREPIMLENASEASQVTPATVAQFAAFAEIEYALPYETQDGTLVLQSKTILGESNPVKDLPLLNPRLQQAFQRAKQLIRKEV